MKSFLRAVRNAAKENLTVAARVSTIAGASLLIAFALVGMIATVEYWLPVLLVGLVICGGLFVYKQREQRIPQERKTQVVDMVCNAVSAALQTEMPCRFDPAPPEEIAFHAQITRDSGADIVSIRLLLLEKCPDTINKALLHKVFAQRLARCSKTPGLIGRACCAEIPLLVPIGLELIDSELTLQVLCADTSAAARYYTRLREEQRQARKEALHKPSPRLQKEENTEPLEGDDLL